MALRHGKRSTYTRHQCRCEECRAANAAYRRETKCSCAKCRERKNASARARRRRVAAQRPAKPSPETRFWAKVNRESDKCWEWQAKKSRGYGVFVLAHGTTVYAHRFAYELMVGPIPEGLEIDHLCRNPGCVRPDHLEPVTRAENARRSPLIGRWSRSAK